MMRRFVLTAALVAMSVPTFAAVNTSSACTTGEMLVGIQNGVQKPNSDGVIKYANGQVTNIWRGPKQTFGIAEIGNDQQELVILVSSKETGDVWRVAACQN